MRFKIELKLLGDAPFSIPINYQSEVSTWVHKVLHFHNSNLKEWFVANKFTDHLGEYKLYTFSDVYFAPGKIAEDRILVEGADATLILSFYAHQDVENIIIESFKGQELKIGDSKGKTAIRIDDIQRIKQPDFKSNTSIVFTCLSPMLIAEPGKNADVYLSPDAKDFDKVFFKNLMARYASLIKYMPNGGGGLSGLNDLGFKIIGKPKPKIIKVRVDTPHQKSVKGFLFDFEVKAPAELLQIGYNCGFGELNHLGFGCCAIK